MALLPPFNIYLEESRTRTIEMNKSTFFLRLTTIAFVALAACSSDDSSSAEYLEQESSSSIEESSNSVEISSSSQEHYSSSSEQIFIDERDGQPYRYVVIGEQTWMAQNLNYTDPAKNYSYDYTPDIADPTLGRYYWDQDAKVSCPAGWHLPRFMDFSKLVMAVGGPDSAGKLLRSTDAWYDRQGETDIYGFAAVPSGMKCIRSVNTRAVFMSAEYAQYGSLYSFNLEAEKPVEWKDNSADCYMVVRCVKDDDFYEPLPDSADVVAQEPCRTKDEDNCEYGTFKDSRDGNEYKTVVIGNQTWMAENLKLEYPYISGCIDNSQDSCAKYGTAYNWAVVMDSLGYYSDASIGCGFQKYCDRPKNVRGICPEGWHLPGLAEYKTLLYAVKESTSKNSNLKAYADSWVEEYGNIDNSFHDVYGFSLLPAGYNMEKTGHFACLWTSYDISPGFAYMLYSDYQKASLKKNEKVVACSVRCVKD